MRAAGLDVIVARSTPSAAEHGQQRVKSLDRGVVGGKLTEDERDEALARITFTTDLGDLADRQLVVEAVVEDEQTKIDVFRRSTRSSRPGRSSPATPARSRS